MKARDYAEFTEGLPLDSMPKMAHTSDIAPGLRRIYRSYLSSPPLNRLIHTILNRLVDVLARMMGFSFPEKFNWEWKLKMLTRKYERETVILCERLITPGMKIVDIGAHIGYFSRIFSRLVGENGVVYCFEPDPENYVILEKNIAALRNTRCFQKAVADTDGSIDFYHVRNSTGCHSIIAPGTDARKTTVESVSVDALIAKKVLNKVDLIKMDIEGGEPIALRGMERLLRTSPHIKLITEFNAKSLAKGNVAPHEFLSQLESFGFSIYCITNDGLIPLRLTSEAELREYASVTGEINLYCKKNV